MTTRELEFRTREQPAHDDHRCHCGCDPGSAAATAEKTELTCDCGCGCACCAPVRAEEKDVTDRR